MVERFIHNKTNFKSNEILAKYLRDIKKEPSLTLEEEKELIKRIKQGDESAKEKLLKAHLKLVVLIARNFTGYDIPIQDLISEGNIGLMKAIEKFNPDKGVRFATYASWWIKQSIKRAILNNSKMIRLPIHAIDLLKSFLKIIENNNESSKKIFNANNRKEAAEELGVDISKIEELILTNQSALSYNQNINGKENMTYEEVLTDMDTTTPFDIYEKKEILEKILSWLSLLNEKERTVIILRFGLLNEQPMTLEEVGNILNLTKERIRQIEEKALKKLQYYLINKKYDKFI
jgi:RNA polymerase primary sigma factor